VKASAIGNGVTRQDGTVFATRHAEKQRTWAWPWRPEVRKALAVTLVAVLCCAVMAYSRIVLQTTIVCTHLAYVPIVLAGMWWGKKAVWVAASIGVFILCARPFVMVPEPFKADLLRSFFFVVVALCVGTISEKAEAAHRKLEAVQNQLSASERLASMGQLSAGVAHELNNPLGTILLYSHMLVKNFDETDPRRDDVRTIVQEATRCKNIVRDLLNFARESRVCKEPAKLASVVSDVLSITTDQAQHANVHLTSNIQENLPTVMIDAAQIRQMLVNLVHNGIDAASENGQVEIRAHLQDDGDAVEIQVIDNGCGVPPENIPKLFTPFFTTKEMGKGTGLGLSIAYGIVKMHAGDISVESDVGKGTIFTVRLPVGDLRNGDIQHQPDDDMRQPVQVAHSSELRSSREHE